MFWALVTGGDVAPVPAYSRPVFPLERLFLGARNPLEPCANQLVVEGRGAPPTEALQHALEVAAEANPGSALRLRGFGWNLNWVNESPPVLSVVDAPLWNGRCEAEAPFLHAPLDAAQGPSCSVASVSSGARHYLVFRSLHAVMDGVGTLLWAMDVMRILRGEEPFGHRSTLTTDMLAGKSKKAFRTTPPRDALHPVGMPGAPQQNAAYRWRRVTVQRPLHHSMVPCVATALARMAWQHQSGAVRFNVPASLRYLAPQEKTTANLIGAIHLDVAPDDTPETLGRRVVQQLYERTPAAPAQYDHAMRFLTVAQLEKAALASSLQSLAMGRHLFSATLSHLGNLTASSLSGGGFSATSAFYVPPHARRLCHVSALSVAINGFEQHVEAICALPAAYDLDDRLDRLAEVVAEALVHGEDDG